MKNCIPKYTNTHTNQTFCVTVQRNKSNGSSNLLCQHLICIRSCDSLNVMILRPLMMWTMSSYNKWRFQNSTLTTFYIGDAIKKSIKISIVYEYGKDLQSRNVSSYCFVVRLSGSLFYYKSDSFARLKKWAANRRIRIGVVWHQIFDKQIWLNYNGMRNVFKSFGIFHTPILWKSMCKNSKNKNEK